MAVTYTSLLGLAKPTTGTEAGTWGDVVNDYLTTYLDSAIAGTQTISGTQTAVTLSITTGGTPLVQAAATSAGSAQYQIIKCTGTPTPTGTLVITAPAFSKVYLVINATTNNQSVTVKASTSTGVTIPALTRSLIAWDGSDYILIASNRITDLTGTLTTGNGGTGLTTFTAANNAIYSSSSSALTAGTLPVAAGGTGATTLTGVVKASGVSAFTAGSVSLSTEVTGTLPIANGGTGATTLTLNNVLLGNGTSAVQVVAPGTSGNVLTSNGTTWSSAALSLPASATGIRASVYTSGSGNFTIPTGVTAVKVTVIGGGGGAGGASSGCCPTPGSGGGAGATSIKYFTGLTPGGTIAYVVGAAGTGGALTVNGGSGGTSTATSGGTTITSTGGTGGGAANSTPGVGGSSTNGDLTINGEAAYTALGGRSTFIRSYGGGGNGTTGAGNSGVAGIVFFEY